MLCFSLSLPTAHGRQLNSAQGAAYGEAYLAQDAAQPRRLQRTSSSRTVHRASSAETGERGGEATYERFSQVSGGKMDGCGGIQREDQKQTRGELVPRGGHQPSLRRLLHPSPASVEASLRQLAEARGRKSAEERVGGSPERSTVNDGDAEVCSKKVILQRTTQARVLLRLHSIQFCFDGENMKACDAARGGVAYCVGARYLPLPGLHSARDNPFTSSFTTAWFAAAVSQQGKTGADLVAEPPAATQTAEAAERGVYRVERCSFETDIRLYDPPETHKHLFNLDKLLVEIWRHEASKASAAAEPPSAQEVHLVGEAAVDLIEGRQAPKNEIIVAIESPSEEKKTSAFVRSLRRSGTLYATFISKAPQQQQPQQDGAWNEACNGQQGLETKEKMWNYIVRLSLKPKFHCM